MTEVLETKGWQGEDAYEAYMGQWSRPLAREFLPWLAAQAGQRWLDVGCGTGALTSAVVEVAEPVSVLGIDFSPDFVKRAIAVNSDPRACFEVGDACDLPLADGGYDVVVSGLVLNHVSVPAIAAAELARATRPGGTVGAYVWDYSEGMERARYFWDAVLATDADAQELYAHAQFPLCRPDPMAALFRSAGLEDVLVEPIDMPMSFRDYDELWTPLIMDGPATPQRYLQTLDEGRRAILKETLQAMLPIAADGSIRLNARAWAVRGKR